MLYSHTHTVSQSSGDTLLDKRVLYAQQMASNGDHADAIDLLEQSISIKSDWAPLYFLIALSYDALGDQPHAVKAYHQYLACDPNDYMGARVKLALLGAIETPTHFGDSYVRALFDQYAPRFEQSLVGALGYCVPQQLYEQVSALRPVTDKQERILDLGCGTGLAGECFAARAAYLEGVDLSPGMIAQADTKKLYDRLVVADITAYLEGAPSQPYDLIVAADVLIYLGVLEALFERVGRQLAPGGLFAFSAQKTGGEGYHLGDDHRFSHALPYLEKTLISAGLEVVDVREGALRADRGVPVAGYMMVARKPLSGVGMGLAIHSLAAQGQKTESDEIPALLPRTA